MVNWNEILPRDLEITGRAFNHGITKEEYEDLFCHPYYREKFRYKGEIRYRIIGKSQGKYIYLICTLSRRTFLSRKKLKIFSGREASDNEKKRYKSRFQ